MGWGRFIDIGKQHLGRAYFALLADDDGHRVSPRAQKVLRRDVNIRFRQAKDPIGRIYKMANLDVNSGRITCEVCNALIGQVDDHNDSKGILELEHFAPCGLPCVCDGAKWEWLAKNAIPSEGGRVALMHTAAACPRCDPKPCPVCHGATVVETEPPNEETQKLHKFADSIGMGDPERFSSWRGTRPSYQRMINGKLVQVPFKSDVWVRYCTRCNKTGKVPGLDADVRTW